MSTKKERLEESLKSTEEEIRHKEYEIRQLKGEWDLVYSDLLEERLKERFKEDKKALLNKLSLEALEGGDPDE